MSVIPFDSRAPKPRKFRPNLKGVPLEWLPGDRQTTHTYDVLSLLLPLGEGWFASVFREALPYLEGDTYQAAHGFMEQEAQHGRTHLAVQRHLADHGIDARAYYAKVAWLFRQFGPKPLGQSIPAAWSKTWLTHRVAAIAAVEQLTTTLGNWILENDVVDQQGAAPAMLDLLRWHGAEEVEHRTVAFEVHEALGGTHTQRMLWMSIAAPLMLGLWIHGVQLLMAENHRVSGGDEQRGSWRSFLRAGKIGTLPSATTLLRGVARFYHPRHHPEHEVGEERARSYLLHAEGLATA